MLVNQLKAAMAAGGGLRVTGNELSQKEVDRIARENRNRATLAKHAELSKAAAEFRELSALAAKQRRVELLTDANASLSPDSTDLLFQCSRTEPADDDRSPDELVKVCQEEFTSVARFLSTMEDSRQLTEEEIRSILAFLKVRDLGIVAENIINVLYILVGEGILRGKPVAESPLPSPVLEQEPVDNSPESKNPYDKVTEPLKHARWFASDEYTALQKQEAREGVEREISPVFRGSVEEICKDCGGWEFSAANMRALMSIMENFRPRLPFTREGIRRGFFSKWGRECPNGVMTAEEHAVMIIDNADPNLTADEFAFSVGANPRFRSAGPPTRAAGRV